VELKVTERLMLMNLLAPIEGNITTLRIVRGLQEKIGFSDEENVALAFHREGKFLGWTETADVPTEIDIGPGAKAIIASQLKSLNAQRALTMQQFDLYERFVEDESEVIE